MAESTRRRRLMEQNGKKAGAEYWKMIYALGTQMNTHPKSIVDGASGKMTLHILSLLNFLSKATKLQLLYGFVGPTKILNKRNQPTSISI